MAAAPLTAATSLPACAASQRVTLEQDKPWKCEAQWMAARAYLLRVDEQSIDVAFEILDASGKALMKVDGPARRAGPEFMLFRPRTAAQHIVVVSAQEQSTSPRVVELQIRALGEASTSALVRGYAALTDAAVVSATPGEVSAEPRLAALRTARQQFRLANAPDLEAHALFRIAAVYYWMLGDWEKAAAAAAEASDAFERLGDPIMMSQARVMRAASLIETANTTRLSGGRNTMAAARSPFVEAQRLLLEAAERFRAANMPYDEAHAINNLGIARHYLGEFDAAREAYVQAARTFAEIGESVSEVLPLQNIAVLDYERGDFDRAAESYEPLLLRLRVEDDPPSYIAILNNLADAQRVLGKLEKALQSYLSALRLAEQYKLSYEEAVSLQGLGSLYWAAGQRDRASVFIERSLQLRRQVNDARGLVTSLIHAGDLYRERGDYKHALELHLQALEKSISPLQKLRSLLAIGRDHVANGALAAAIGTYRTALALDLPQDWPDRVALSSAYGYALLSNGDAEGRKLMERAIASHRKYARYDLAARDLYSLAELDYRNGRVTAASQEIDQALDLFEAERVRAITPDMRAQYVASRAAAFELQAEINMRLAEQAKGDQQRKLRERALSSAEMRRLRALEDLRQLTPGAGEGRAGASPELLQLDQRLSSRRQRLAMLLEQTHPSADSVERLQKEIEVLRAQLDLLEATDSSRRLSLKVKSVADVQNAMDSDAVLLTYVRGRERSWLWSITRDSAEVYPMPSAAALEQAANELHASWSNPARPVDPQYELERSRILLGPAQRTLQQKRAVIVVTDGVLRQIPFAALRIESGAGANGQRLIEEHRVSYRPSLSGWSDLNRTPNASNRILLVGDPQTPAMTSNVEALNVARQSRPRLPGAQREIESIAGLAKGWQADVLLGVRASKRELLARPLRNYRVLHFATHAQLDVHDPELSSILLTAGDAPGEFSNGDLTLREIVGLGLDADSVVLSACEGSMGKDYQGQLTFGLSEAFLIAGARHVLGGLWRVSDAAARRYMETFYEHYLREGASPASAAQLSARAMSRDRTFAHPYFWAAFVLIERPFPG
jgi:CHAT domain-containing protein